MKHRVKIETMKKEFYPDLPKLEVMLFKSVEIGGRPLLLPTRFWPTIENFISRAYDVVKNH